MLLSLAHDKNHGASISSRNKFAHAAKGQCTYDFQHTLESEKSSFSMFSFPEQRGLLGPIQRVYVTKMECSVHQVTQKGDNHILLHKRGFFQEWKRPIANKNQCFDFCSFVCPFLSFFYVVGGSYEQ